jgi:hypothetical protein
MTIWLLARFPRPIVASLSAIFRASVVTVILLAFALIAVIACAIFLCAVYWAWVITGGTVSSDISSFAIFQASCGGALMFPAGVFVFLAWHMLKEFDSELPRREKKS